MTSTKEDKVKQQCSMPIGTVKPLPKCWLNRRLARELQAVVRGPMASSELSVTG